VHTGRSKEGRPETYFLFRKNIFYYKLANSSCCAYAKKRSALTRQGLCPWTPLGALPQTHVTGSHSALTMWSPNSGRGSASGCTVSRTYANINSALTNKQRT